MKGQESPKFVRTTHSETYNGEPHPGHEISKPFGHFYIEPRMRLDWLSPDGQNRDI